MLSIIITHYKTPAILKLCIKNIQKYCSDLDYEIIVVDSEASSYNKLLVNTDFSNVVYIGFKENVGYAKVVNSGIKIAKGEFVLILNADIIVTENSVQSLINLMIDNPDFGLVSPRLLNFNGTPQYSCFRFYRPLTILYRRTFFGKLPWGKRALDRFLYKDKLVGNPGNSISCIEVDWSMGSALMARHEAIKKVGLIDERFFMYFEDVDWAKRFKDNGYKVIYCLESQMYHYHQRASSKKGGIYDILINKYTRAHIRSAIKYFLKHGIK